MANSDDDDRLRVFIGDVQGCADELEQLLEALRFDPGSHALYFAGDLVNRGPRSLAALRLAREHGAESVIGNHDLHLVARADDRREAKPGDTLEEILAAPDRDDLVEWLRARPVLLTWSDIVLVHAGISPRWERLDSLAARIAAEIDWSDPLAHPDLRFATTARYCDPDGRVPPRELEAPALASTGKGVPGVIEPPYRAWDEFWQGPRTVVFGHWAQRGLVRRNHVRGLDTGCVWGGSLTAWVAEEDRFVSIPARRTYQDYR